MTWRWKKHCSASRGKSNCYFHNAIRKYGTSDDVWTHEVLENCETKEDARDRAEPYWIALLETFGPKGYNLTKGGEGVRAGPMSLEMRRKLSIANKGKRIKPEIRQYLSEINTGERHPMYGKKHTSQAKAAMKASKVSYQKAVEQLDLDGNFIARYESARKLIGIIPNIDCTKIGLCCRGKRKTAYGFMWRYP